MPGKHYTIIQIITKTIIIKIIISKIMYKKLKKKYIAYQEKFG